MNYTINGEFDCLRDNKKVGITFGAGREVIFLVSVIGGEERQHVRDQTVQGARATGLQPQQVDHRAEPTQVLNVQPPLRPLIKVAQSHPGPWHVQHNRTGKEQRPPHPIEILELPCDLILQEQATQRLRITNEDHSGTRTWGM